MPASTASKRPPATRNVRKQRLSTALPAVRDEEAVSSLRSLRLSKSLGQQLVLSSCCTGATGALVLIVVGLRWMAGSSSVKLRAGRCLGSMWVASS
jgi:hypothetical protein